MLICWCVLILPFSVLISLIHVYMCWLWVLISRYSIMPKSATRNHHTSNLGWVAFMCTSTTEEQFWAYVVDCARVDIFHRLCAKLFHLMCDNLWMAIWDVCEFLNRNVSHMNCYPFGFDSFFIFALNSWLERCFRFWPTCFMEPKLCFLKGLEFWVQWVVF